MKGRKSTSSPNHFIIAPAIYGSFAAWRVYRTLSLRTRLHLLCNQFILMMQWNGRALSTLTNNMPWIIIKKAKMLRLNRIMFYLCVCVSSEYDSQQYCCMWLGVCVSLSLLQLCRVRFCDEFMHSELIRFDLICRSFVLWQAITKINIHHMSYKCVAFI